MNSFSLGGRDRKREEPTMNACINYDDLRLEDYSCSGQQQSVPNPGTNVTSTAKLNRLENRPGVYERYLAVSSLSTSLCMGEWVVEWGEVLFTQER